MGKREVRTNSWCVRSVVPSGHQEQHQVMIGWEAQPPRPARGHTGVFSDLINPQREERERWGRESLGEFPWILTGGTLSWVLIEGSQSWHYWYFGSYNFFTVRVVLCTVGWLAASLASTCEMPIAPSVWQSGLQTWPNVFWGSPIENHCCKTNTRKWQDIIWTWVLLNRPDPLHLGNKYVLQTFCRLIGTNKLLEQW